MLGCEMLVSDLPVVYDLNNKHVAYPFRSVLSAELSTRCLWGWRRELGRRSELSEAGVSWKRGVHSRGQYVLAVILITKSECSALIAHTL